MTGWQSLADTLRSQAVRAGCCPGRFDRALDLLADGGLQDAIGKYGTTMTGCGCPDRQFRRARRCKHQIALIAAERLRRRLSNPPERL